MLSLHEDLAEKPTACCEQFVYFVSVRRAIQLSSEGTMLQSLDADCNAAMLTLHMQRKIVRHEHLDNVNGR
jgi:hypothetical protein